MESPIADFAPTVLIIAACIIALVPWARHYILYIRLQISLVTRLGPIWEETEGIRAPFIGKDNFLDELNEIERKYGDQLTDQESGWLDTSRRQQAISTRWPLAVFDLLVVSLLAIYSAKG